MVKRFEVKLKSSSTTITSSESASVLILSSSHSPGSSSGSETEKVGEEHGDDQNQHRYCYNGHYRDGKWMLNCRKEVNKWSINVGAQHIKRNIHCYMLVSVQRSDGSEAVVITWFSALFLISRVMGELMLWLGNMA